MRKSKPSASKKGGKQGRLVEMNLLPSLKKTSEAVGEKVQVPGAYWEGCPPADLDKIYLCTVIRFEAMHTFHGGLKSAAFIMQEMGESGEGSLEPGDSSGEVFAMMYPQPFVLHYYKTFPSKLPAHMQPARVAADYAAGTARLTIAGGADGEGVEI